MQANNWDWALLWSNAERIGLAYLIALPLGIEREQEAHSVGVRTFPIVAMASCGYVLISQALLAPPGGTPDPAAVSRMLQGLVAGIGFVGGGAILKEGVTIHGTAAAASIWNVGAIGAAVALGRTEIAVLLSLLNLATLYLLIPLRNRLGGK
ncbi:MgtC/SapB family protein [Nevskia soli]|jgi:putative Mg2+ transporter-C (MgtC) family protein|uniref:MgtC/SapB family protein n=1 Tax=Nevskia soli TaxID=418856 RepID=UPI0015D95A7A|nr:MgtC/SapB family protein [Nevskia soli]